MALRRSALQLAAGLLLVGCTPSDHPAAPAPKPPVPQVDSTLIQGARAWGEADQIARIQPRPAGSPGAEAAALHLQGRLREAGLVARLDVFTNNTPKGPMVFRNVIGEWTGTGTNLVIVGSHYDTKTGIENFAGANDSASSSGTLLELGRTLAQQGVRLPFTVQLVFFDGEECQVSYGDNDGLHGSRHHAASLVQAGQTSLVKAVIVLDMIGDRNLSVTLPRNATPSLLAMVLEESYPENARPKFSLYPGFVGDDHEPFFDAGMPAVDIIDFEYGSSPGANDYWHTPSDTMDKVAPDSLQTIGRITLRMLNRLARENP